MKLKYLNTVLQYYRALTLFPLPTRYGADRPLCDMIAVPLLMHNICLTKDRAQIQGGNVPHTTLLQYLTPQLIIPALVITLRTSETPIYIDSPSVCQVIFRSLYLLPLHSFGLLRSHSAPIMWQWRMSVLNCPVYSTLPANWLSRINNGGPSPLWLINGKASTLFNSLWDRRG